MDHSKENSSKKLFHLNIAELQKSNAYIKRPRIIDFMESNGHELRRADHLHYFKDPPRTLYPLDLNKGYEQYKFRYDTYEDRQLNKIENYIMKKGIASLDMDALAETGELTKICTRRNTLNRIMMAPYYFGKGSTIATKHNGIIYMTPKPENQTWQHTKSSTHHFKFEQYCYADSTKTAPDTDVPIDENKQLFGIFCTQLDRFQLLYSVEVDGVLADEDITDLTDLEQLNKCCFITTKLLMEKEGNWRLSPKILKWWVQAYFANVNDIYMAFKDKKGFVKSPGQHVAVNDLPEGQRWQPKVCFGFLHKFLTTLAEAMSDVNCPHTVYEFKFENANKTISYEVHKGKNELSFLTEEFVEYLQNQQ